MKKIGFVVDSTFGNVGDMAKVVPLNVYIDNKEYIDGTFDNNLIVDALKNDLEVKTSQPSPNLFLMAFEEALEEYDHVICLTISKTLSGTINSAILAKGMLEDEERVTVIDTKTVNLGSSYILEEAYKKANDNYSLKDVLNYIDELILKGSIIFSVDDLDTLVKGGRLSKINAFIGNIFKIKPILRFKEGVLNVEARVRGLMGVFRHILKQVEEMLSSEKITVRVTYVDNLDYANNMKERIENLNHKNLSVQITEQLTAAVAAHIGLGGMGIYLINN